MNHQTKIFSTRTQPALDSTNGGITRRRFVSRCAACMGCGALSLLDKNPNWAAEAVPKRPKIRLVFCETPNNQPIWPNIGYDFATRRKQISGLLTKHCQDLDFLAVSLMNDPKQADSVLRQEAEVDGYVVCVEGLGWNNNIAKLCTTGKPTLLVDNLFGGSGLFLQELSGIMGANKPVDWVSSSNDLDLVESVRHFAGLAKGKSSAETAAAFRATRRTRSRSRSVRGRERAVTSTRTRTTIRRTASRKITKRSYDERHPGDRRRSGVFR